MTRGRQIGNLVGVTAPFVGCPAAIVLLWNEVVNWTDLALLGSAYVLTAIGVTVGYHRLLTHRAFITYKPVEYVLAGLGSMSLQGSVIDWVADHRKHHAHTDEEGDPHSPHVGHGSGVSGPRYAHTGWLFRSHGQAEHRRYAKDLDEDRGMRLLSERYHVWVILSLGIPFALGFWLHGNFAGGVRGSSGAVSCASSSCTTSPGRSTPCATSSAAGVSRSRTTPPTSLGSRFPRSARHGTSTTTRSPLRQPRAALVGDRPLGLGDPRDGVGRPCLDVVRISPSARPPRSPRDGSRSSRSSRARARHPGRFVIEGGRAHPSHPDRDRDRPRAPAPRRRTRPGAGDANALRQQLDPAATRDLLADRAPGGLDHGRHGRDRRGQPAGTLPPLASLLPGRCVRLQVEDGDEAGPQLRGLGFSPDDVRWVVMTHMHTDHAGGLHHFPRSEILITPEELSISRSTMGRLRGYLPQSCRTGSTRARLRSTGRHWAPSSTRGR